jgi:hypothetical protein
MYNIIVESSPKVTDHAICFIARFFKFVGT